MREMAEGLRKEGRFKEELARVQEQVRQQILEFQREEEKLRAEKHQLE